MFTETRKFRPISPTLVLVLTGACFMACSPASGDGDDALSSEGDPSQLGDAPQGTTGSGIPGSTPGLSLDPASNNGEEVFCTEVDLNFEPKTPTVYLLVDQSGSMWDYNFWESTQTGLLEVVSQLEADVRFGFGTFAGTSSTCTGLNDSGILSTFAEKDISAYYSTLSKLDKGETPTSLGYQQVLTLLAEDKVEQAAAGTPVGEQYILLVTDGEPDYCDDSSLICAQDSVVAEIQKGKTQGVNTLVFGLTGPGQDLTGTLDRWANAGAGSDVAHLTSGGTTVVTKPQGEGQPSQLYYQCKDKTQWNSSNPSNSEISAGQYAEANGEAKAFSSSETSALVDSIRATVSGLKSCELDLSASGVSIDPDFWTQGSVKYYIKGLPGEADSEVVVAPDQWEMTSETLLKLKGEACEGWKSPDVSDFFAGFPCEGIILR